MSALNNARWAGFSQAGRVVLQLISLAVLARLIPPSEYGLMAMAGVVTNLAGLLRDMGTAAAVIQKNKLTDELLSTVFWLNMLIGTTVALALFVFAPLIAAGFREPSLKDVLWALALIFPITSSAATHQALLERASSFRELAVIEVGSACVGLVAAIVGALMGMGVYSLVLQSVVTQLLSTLMLWRTSRWRPRRIWSQSEFKGLLGFSGHLSLFNFINYFSRNADGVIIGRYLGSTTLGAYAMAYKLMMFPLQSMTMVAARSLYPIMSRQQDSVHEMASLYLRAVGLIAFVTAPLMVGLFVLREPFVRIAFGPQWDSVVDILAWLAPCGFIQSIVSTTGTVFMARGRTDVLSRIGFVTAIGQVSAFAIGVQWGVIGVVQCYLLANIFNFVICMTFAMRQLDTSFLKLITVLSRPVCFSLLMGGLVFLFQSYRPASIDSSLFSFIFSVGLGIAVYAAFIFFLARHHLFNALAVIRGRQLSNNG